MIKIHFEYEGPHIIVVMYSMAFLLMFCLDMFCFLFYFSQVHRNLTLLIFLKVLDSLTESNTVSFDFTLHNARMGIFFVCC